MSKKRRKAVVPRKTRLAHRLFLALLGCVIIAVLVWKFGRQEKPLTLPQKPAGKTTTVARITPKDYVMSWEAAYQYATDIISPILMKQINSDDTLPAIRSRLVDFGEKVKNQEIEYLALPAYNPQGKDFLLKVDFDPEKERPVVMLFVPAVQEEMRKLSAKDFEPLMAITFAHEMIHLELEGPEALRKRMGKPYDYETAKEEAKVWGITILEIVRPLEARGQMPFEYMLVSSENLKKVNDDYTHPAWIDAFFRKDKASP